VLEHSDKCRGPKEEGAVPVHQTQNVVRGRGLVQAIGHPAQKPEGHMVEAVAGLGRDSPMFKNYF
jgi:hypothetical protein